MVDTRGRLFELVVRLSLPLLIVAVSVALGCFDQGDGSSLEERAIGLDKRLMCPVCPAETLDQSQVEIASQMRAIVREMLAEGASDQEVLDFFVERYGASVLSEPPKAGFNAVVWLMPPLGLLVGGSALFFVVREMRKGRRDEEEDERKLDEEALHPYLSQVDREFGSISEPVDGHERQEEG